MPSVLSSPPSLAAISAVVVLTAVAIRENYSLSQYCLILTAFLFLTILPLRFLMDRSPKGDH